MGLFFWRKEGPGQDGAYAPYEEIGAKRTSQLGYFFLALMVIFGVLQGNSLLQAIEETVTRPESNSSCSQQLAQYAQYDFTSENYDIRSEYYGRKTTHTQNSVEERVEACRFSAREKLAGLDEAYKKLIPLIEKSTVLDSEISSLRMQMKQLQTERNETVQDYQAALNEDVADTENGGVFDTNQIGSGILTKESQISSLASALSQKERELKTVASQILKTASTYTTALKQVDSQYAQEIRIYTFKQFLLSFVLVIPLFILAWIRYHRARLMRSEYTIVWGGIVATVGFIVAQVLLVFIYEILPRDILQAIFALLASVKIIVTLLYWLGFILVPLFFGFLIYLIQKRFYNKRAVMMRALKSGHCPHCTLTINRTMNNCPVCGYTLKSRCETCGAMSMSGGAFCEACGSKRDQQVTS